MFNEVNCFIDIGTKPNSNHLLAYPFGGFLFEEFDYLWEGKRYFY